MDENDKYYYDKYMKYKKKYFELVKVKQYGGAKRTTLKCPNIWCSIFQDRWLLNFIQKLNFEGKPPCQKTCDKHSPALLFRSSYSSNERIIQNVTLPYDISSKISGSQHSIFSAFVKLLLAHVTGHKQCKLRTYFYSGNSININYKHILDLFKLGDDRRHYEILNNNNFDIDRYIKQLQLSDIIPSPQSPQSPQPPQPPQPTQTPQYSIQYRKSGQYDINAGNNSSSSQNPNSFYNANSTYNLPQYVIPDSIPGAVPQVTYSQVSNDSARASSNNYDYVDPDAEQEHAYESITSNNAASRPAIMPEERYNTLARRPSANQAPHSGKSYLQPDYDYVAMVNSPGNQLYAVPGNPDSRFKPLILGSRPATVPTDTTHTTHTVKPNIRPASAPAASAHSPYENVPYANIGRFAVENAQITHKTGSSVGPPVVRRVNTGLRVIPTEGYDIPQKITYDPNTGKTTMQPNVKYKKIEIIPNLVLDVNNNVCLLRKTATSEPRKIIHFSLNSNGQAQLILINGDGNQKPYQFDKIDFIGNNTGDANIVNCTMPAMSFYARN